MVSAARRAISQARSTRSHAPRSCSPRAARTRDSAWAHCQVSVWYPIRPALRLLEQREGLDRLPEMEIVEPEVDQGADLDIAVLDLFADVGALPVVLHRAAEVAQLLVQPPDGVLEPPDEELVVPILRLGETLVDHGQALGMIALGDMRLAPEGQRKQLVKAVPGFSGLLRHLPEDGQGPRKVPAPLHVGGEEDPARHGEGLEAPGLADAQRLRELLV